MGQKKDIGTLFEEKLNNTTKTPSASLWKKINTSLDEEERRKKRMLFYWLIGGGSVALLGLILLFGNNFYPPKHLENQQNSVNLSNQPNNSLYIESNRSTFETPIADSLNNQKTHEKLSKINSSIDGLQQNENVSSSGKNSEISTKKISPNKKSVEETFTISKKYYYYNSLDGKHIVTESKNEIDSLVDQKHKSVDSTKSLKQNHLEE